MPMNSIGLLNFIYKNLHWVFILYIFVFIVLFSIVFIVSLHSIVVFLYLLCFKVIIDQNQSPCIHLLIYFGNKCNSDFDTTMSCQNVLTLSLIHHQRQHFGPAATGFTSVCHFSQENSFSALIWRLQLNYGIAQCSLVCYIC